jgi:transketolase
MMKKANKFILLYHTAAKDDIAKRPKAAKMFCGGQNGPAFSTKTGTFTSDFAKGCTF